MHEKKKRKKKLTMERVIVALMRWCLAAGEYLGYNFDNDKKGNLLHPKYQPNVSNKRRKDKRGVDPNNGLPIQRRQLSPLVESITLSRSQG